MKAILHIEPGVFTARPSLYRILRDGFCLMIIDDRSAQGYVLSREQDLSILRLCGLPLTESILEAYYVNDGTQAKLPSDEWIIEYCILKAIIPHPVEEYG